MLRKLPLLLLTLALLAVPAPASAYEKLRPGDRGAKVRELQRALHVPADGDFGPRTTRAVRRYQRRHGLRVTGVVNKRMAGMLGLGKRSRHTPFASTGSGGAAYGDEPDDGPSEPSGRAARAVQAARSAIGTPYAYGGESRDGFDCSGLTSWAYRKAGLRLPRTSFDQYEAGDRVARSDIRAGDLVFFDSSGPGASHVGIATGRGKAISATSSGGVMEHSTRSGYWGSHYVGARRP